MSNYGLQICYLDRLPIITISNEIVMAYERARAHTAFACIWCDAFNWIVLPPTGVIQHHLISRIAHFMRHLPWLITINIHFRAFARLICSVPLVSRLGFGTNWTNSNSVDIDADDRNEKICSQLMESRGYSQTDCRKCSIRDGCAHRSIIN